MDEVIGELQRNPFQPGLKLHTLGGKLGGCYAVSFTYSEPRYWPYCRQLQGKPQITTLTPETSA